MILASALYGGTAPFSSFPIFTGSKTVKFPDELEGTDALVVWGGEDIHPALYNDVNTHSSVYTDGPSTRDTYEWALMKEAIKRDIPIIGVCRGAQRLCAV